MDCTGERVIEEEYKKKAGSYLVYLFHLATYRYAIPHVRGKTVLDFGCGTGYGSLLLSSHCPQITGIDISHEAIDFATRTYHADNLRFLRVAPIEQGPLPFADHSFDAVVSFQVVEHVTDVQRYFLEIRRVLKDDGILVLATPDRSTRLFPGQKPWNLYHLHEYGPEQLTALLRAHFDVIEIAGMSARDDLLAGELKRTDRMRILSYPFTFPGIPECFRRAALGLLKRFQSLMEKTRQQGGGKFDFGEEDISISPGAKPSINIVVVARKKARNAVDLP